VVEERVTLEVVGEENMAVEGVVMVAAIAIGVNSRTKIVRRDTIKHTSGTCE
jgi:hypothetical protein